MLEHAGAVEPTIHQDIVLVLSVPICCCLPQPMKSVGWDVVCVEYRAEARIKTSGPVFLTLRYCCPGDIIVISPPLY